MATSKQSDAFEVAINKWVKANPEFEDSDVLDSGGNLPVEQVDPNKVISSGQQYVHPDYSKGNDGRPVTLIEMGGKYMVYDGHHRVAAAIAQKRNVAAKVIHVGEAKK